MVLDRKTPPYIHDAVEFDYVLPAIQEHKLSNGLPLYWLNAGVQDVAEIDFVFPAGLWYEPKPAVTHATAGLLKNGTSKRTAHQINEALEFYGASFKINPGNDYSTASLFTLTKHLPDILPIIYEIFTDAIFPEEELAIHKQNSIQRLLVHLKQCDFVADQKIDAVIFGESHPYGRFSKKEKIEALTREDLLLFYNTCFAFPGMKIFMAGNIGPKEVNVLEQVFGKTAFPKTEVQAEAFAPPPPSEKKQHFINDAEGVQGAIRIGRQFPNRLHPDFAPMVVLNTLFGGYFGSRLMSNIREDKGYTYGIYSSTSPNLNGGSLTIHTEVGRDVIEPAIREIYHEMKQLCDVPADNDELLLVKNYLLGNLLGDLDGPFSILQRWRTLILNGMGAEHFNRNVSIYKTVTAKELNELAAKYYCADDFYEVVVI
jgi:zinc protease